MTSKKIDQILLSLGVLLISISFYQLFLQNYYQGSGGISLGTLSQARAVVKMKGAQSLDWRDAHSGSDVSERQLIYTDVNSSAEVKFLKGHKVAISENSLVRLSTISGSGLNVQRGVIRAHVDEGEPLLIEVDGSELKLTGNNADIQISLQGDSGEIGVLNGELTVEKAGQIETIDKNSSLKVHQGDLKKLPLAFTLVDPLPSQTIYSLKPEADVIFKWNPHSAATLSLASNQSFKNSKKYQGQGQLQERLSAGSYYWRVEDESGTSLIGTFSIIQEFSPEILRPKDGEKIQIPRDADSRVAEVFVQWKGEAGYEYVVEWFLGELHSERVVGTGLALPLASGGDFKWRVKSADPERSLAQWSEWQNVQIEVIELPAIPIDLSPEELELQSYAGEEFDVELSWKAQGSVELEVLTPNNERVYESIEENSYTLKVRDPGTYRWRLRGSNKFGRYSDWTEFKTFSLKDLSHEVTQKGHQQIELKRPDQEVTFNWEAERGTQTIFELSEEKDFSHVIIRKEVSSNEVKVIVPKVGSYYWRSRQFKSDGTFEVSEPRKVIIRPAPLPARPKRLPDLEIPLEWQESSMLHQKSWMDYFISPAYADEVKSIARIQLPENDDAKKYVIRIYQDREGKQLILEKILEGNQFEWINPRPGHYYWQYALIDYWDRQTPFSDISSIHLTGVAPIFPEQAKLLSPIRASEVSARELTFNWTHSEKNKSYRIEISRAKDFSQILWTETTQKNHVVFSGPPLGVGLHYWRIVATNDSTKETLSNSGRFIIVVDPQLERIVIADQRAAWIKKYGRRVSFAWAPSSDVFEFEGEGKKGKIDGNALNSFEGRAIYFGEKIIYSGDILRQSGEVFKGEKYLFQRILFNATWKKKTGNHLWGPGLSLGSISGHSYEIKNDAVEASSVSGMLYGPHVQGYYALSKLWELQGKFAYLLGEVPHMEFTGEANRQMKNFYLLMGLGYSLRSYSVGDGNQSSLRLSLGIGKDF